MPADDERDYEGLWARRPEDEPARPGGEGDEDRAPARRSWAPPTPPSTPPAGSAGWPRPSPAGHAGPSLGSTPVAPAAPLETARPGGDVLARFEPLHQRAALARGALVVVVVVAVAVVVGDALEIELLKRIDRGEAVQSSSVSANDTRQTVLAVAQLVAYLLAAVAFIRWLNLAYRGLDAVRGERRYHTGWSIGGWFVPILNLWRPKQAVNDLWTTVRRPEEPATSALLLFWWIAFLLNGVVQNGVARAAGSADGTAREAIAVDAFDVAASVVSAVGAVLAIAVVMLLTRRLHERAGVAPPA